MKTILTTIATAVLGVLMTTATLADDHAAPRTSALEVYFCSFAEEKKYAGLRKGRCRLG